MARCNQRTKKTVLFIWFCLALYVIPGCVNYSGLKQQQKLKKPSEFATKKSIVSTHGSWPTMDWAKQFDKQLPQLIEEGLAKNPNLQNAFAKKDQAQALVNGYNAALYPQVHFLDMISRSKIDATPLHALENFGLEALSFSYELDFWGKHYAALAQALSQEQASEVMTYQAALIIGTSIASLYNQLDYQYRYREVVAHTVEQRARLKNITKKLLHSGLATDVQLYQDKTELATSNAKLIAIDADIQRTRQQLGVLLGGGPDRGFAIAKPHLPQLADFKLPDHLPLDLIGRRPDLVAARWQVESALQGAKQVKAEFYPNVDLSALLAHFTFGSQRLFSHNNQFRGGGVAVHLPVFDAGVLRAKLQGKYALLDEQIATYNGALNNAFGEVAEQLTLIRSINQQLVIQKRALESSAKAYNLAQKQYEFGLTSQLLVLNTESHYINQQQNRLLLIKSRRDLQIALIKALGGGFDEALLTVKRTIVTPDLVLKKDNHV